MNIVVEIGRISKHLAVVELVIRAKFSCQTLDDVAKKALIGRFARHSDIDEGDDQKILYRLQGRIENTSGKRIDDLSYDVSYYAGDGSFLGLTKSGFFADDEMESDDHLAIDLELDIPEETHRCVFNARAKCKGWLSRKLF